jgi:Beta-lactamase superfamily domain
MTWAFHPDTRCTLDLNGETLTLTGAQLAALRDALPDTGRALERALPRDVLRRLFTSGMLSPAELVARADTAYWQAVLPTVALSPYLRVHLSFLADHALPENIEPAIGLFLPPPFVELAAQLAALFRRSLTDAAKSCAVRGVPFPRAEVLTVLQNAVKQCLATHPESATWLTWHRQADGTLALALTPAALATSSSPTYPWVRLSFVLEGKPGHQPAREVIVPVSALPAVTRIMDALRTGMWDEQRLANVNDSAVPRVLSAIESVGGFMPKTEAPPLFACANDEGAALTVTHMGHASLIVDGGGQRLLIDPWLFPWDDQFETQPLVASQLGPVAAIFFTHHHADHLDVGSLLTLPHEVPVFVPVDADAPLQPRLAAFLRLMGFTDVRALAHGESYVCGDGLCIEAVSFFGEGQNRVGFGANCYVVSRRGRTVLIHADAAPDSTGRSIVNSGVLEQLVARYGAVDAIWGTWWQERTFACLLSPFLIFSPTLPPARWLDDTELCDCPPDFLCELMRVSGASHLFSYAEGGAQLFLPPSHRVAGHAIASQLLWQPLPDVRARLWRDQKVSLVEALPYLCLMLPVQGALSCHGMLVAPRDY